MYNVSMAMESAYAWVCEWCNHHWLAKSEAPPAQCAKCRRSGWHKTLTTKELVREGNWEQKMTAIAQSVVDQARKDHAAKLAGNVAAITTEMPMGSGASLASGYCGKRFRVADTGQWWLCGKMAGHKLNCGGNAVLDKDQMDD